MKRLLESPLFWLKQLIWSSSMTWLSLYSFSIIRLMPTWQILTYAPYLVSSSSRVKKFSSCSFQLTHAHHSLLNLTRQLHLSYLAELLQFFISFKRLRWRALEPSFLLAIEP